MKLAPAIREDRSAGILTTHRSTAAVRAKQLATRARRHDERRFLRDIVRFGLCNTEIPDREPRAGHITGTLA